MAMGFDAMVELLPEKDRRLLHCVANSLCSRYSSIPKEQRSETVLYLDFHIGHGATSLLVNHKLTWIDIDDNRLPNVAFDIATPPVHHKEHLVFLKIASADVFQYFDFDVDTCQWEDAPRLNINDNERQMLCLASRGFSIMEIAAMMSKSTDTINSYRRNVFKKLNVNSIAEAVALAIQHGFV